MNFFLFILFICFTKSQETQEIKEIKELQWCQDNNDQHLIRCYEEYQDECQQDLFQVDENNFFN